MASHNYAPLHPLRHQANTRTSTPTMRRFTTPSQQVSCTSNILATFSPRNHLYHSHTPPTVRLHTIAASGIPDAKGAVIRSRANIVRVREPAQVRDTLGVADEAVEEEEGGGGPND